MKKSLLSMGILLILAAFLFGCTAGEQPEQNGAGDSEAAVKQVVEDFGAQLKEVSLLAPAEAVRESLQENYGDYVSPALLAAWQDDPENAPGRLVSSPWPDRIEVLNIKELSAEAYEVEGEIVEVTSTDDIEAGEGTRRPITLTVKKIEGDWLIDAVTLGEYADAEGIIYRNDEYGFTFALPASWEGYEIVTEEWKGTAIGGTEGEEEIAESGPMIRIRHPQWTSEEPRQDIPIMVFTPAQWEALQQREFNVGAAPVPPRELDRNSEYVFALPARYNFEFPTGYEEVEEILEGDPLQAD